MKGLSIADLRRQAKRYLPRILFDWIDGGAGDEYGLWRNESAFRDIAFMPRYLLDVTERTQRRSLFGKMYDSPFGIAPMGYTGLFRPGSDLAMARAAAAANIPFVLSGSSTESMERVAAAAPHHAWYQLYGAADLAITEDLVRRAAGAGCQALVVTVDIPVAAKRERDQRNGFSLPLRYTPRLVLDGLLHPLWTARYVRSGGMPMMENWSAYAPEPRSALDVAMFANSHSYCVQTWAHLERFRRLWPRHLIVKGIMHPDDAVRAVSLGADGLIVSNHGGRQYDRAPTALDLFPAVRSAVEPSIPVMLDGGIRRGSDVLACLGLGASFVFLGRAMLYGAVTGGEQGVAHAIAIIRDELDQLMGQVGCIDLSALPPDLIVTHHGDYHGATQSSGIQGARPEFRAPAR